MQQKIILGSIAIFLFGIGAISGAIFANSEIDHQSAEKTADAQKGQQDVSPYAGQQDRAIKYLAAEDVSALQQGKGKALGGMAKPAELNSYPGPRHVLDLSKKLNVTAEQEQELQLLFGDMKQEAQLLGQQFLEVEQKIDNAYAQGEMTDKKLKRLLDQAGKLYGELRYVHLAYHFETKDILTQEQIAHYNRLRGYASNGSMDHSGGEHAG